MAENCLLKPNLLLPGVLMIIFALISDNAVRADVNFKSRPTTVKTFENDSLLLPCYSSTGKAKIWKQHSLRVGNFLIIKKIHRPFLSFFKVNSSFISWWKNIFFWGWWKWKKYVFIWWKFCTQHDERNLIMKNYIRELSHEQIFCVWKKRERKVGV